MPKTTRTAFLIGAIVVGIIIATAAIAAQVHGTVLKPAA